jgi:glycosyltransferase involved in cell wall biosynthesis
MVPNRWEEPFGLIMVEGGATGTPTIGTNRGAIPELIEDGKTGFIVDLPILSNGELAMGELVSRFSSSVENLSSLNPADCRASVEQKFSKESMGRGYLEFYRRILG